MFMRLYCLLKGFSCSSCRALIYPIISSDEMSARMSSSSWQSFCFLRTMSHFPSVCCTCLNHLYRTACFWLSECSHIVCPDFVVCVSLHSTVVSSCGGVFGRSVPVCAVTSARLPWTRLVTAGSCSKPTTAVASASAASLSDGSPCIHGMPSSTTSWIAGQDMMAIIAWCYTHIHSSTSYGSIVHALCPIQLKSVLFVFYEVLLPLKTV